LVGLAAFAASGAGGGFFGSIVFGTTGGAVTVAGAFETGTASGGGATLALAGTARGCALGGLGTSAACAFVSRPR
jgi:hypothetical protein